MTEFLGQLDAEKNEVLASQNLLEILDFVKKKKMTPWDEAKLVEAKQSLSNKHNL